MLHEATAEQAVASAIMLMLGRWVTVGHLVSCSRESAERRSTKQHDAGRIARWVFIGAGVIGAGLIVLGCGGNAGSEGSDAPGAADDDAPSPAARALLDSSGECVWVKVAECRADATIGDWCGEGFYAATLQRCPDVGGTLYSASGIFPSLSLNGCRPACTTDLSRVSSDAVECCPDGIPGTPVPEEGEDGEP